MPDDKHPTRHAKNKSAPRKPAYDPTGNTRLIETYVRALKGYTGADSTLKASELANNRWEPRDSAAAEYLMQQTGHDDIATSRPSNGLLNALKSISRQQLHGIKLDSGTEEVQAYEELLQNAAKEAEKLKEAFSAKRWHDIEQLHPLQRLPAIQALQELERLGIPFRITQSYRDPKDQDGLVRQGDSYAPEGYSLHGIGMALDIVPPTKHGAPNWNATPAQWKGLQDVVTQYGFDVIGNWDLPHYQTPIGTQKAVHLPEVPSGWKMLSVGDLSPCALEANAGPISAYQSRAIVSAAAEQADWPKAPPMLPDHTRVVKPGMRFPTQGPKK